MDLALLINLQDVDKAIMKLESSIGDLPQQVHDLRLKVESVEEELSQQNETLNQCDTKKRKLEASIELATDKLKKYQQQMYSVTTNKEYDAISSEIEIKEKEIEETETKVLEIMEQEENLNRQIQQTEEQLRQLRADLQEKDSRLTNKIKENEQELDKLLREKKSIVEQIDKPVYANYERIRKGRSGIALVEVKNYTCLGCFATIPAQAVVEIRKNDKLIHCETCGRILYCTNDGALAISSE